MYSVSVFSRISRQYLNLYGLLPRENPANNGNKLWRRKKSFNHLYEAALQELHDIRLKFAETFENSRISMLKQYYSGHAQAEDREYSFPNPFVGDNVQDEPIHYGNPYIQEKWRSEM